MNMQPVDSSNIESVGYENDTLAVKFKSGKTYTYPGVPAELHAQMLQAESVGKFFLSKIKPHYPHKV